MSYLYIKKKINFKKYFKKYLKKKILNSKLILAHKTIHILNSNYSLNNIPSNKTIKIYFLRYYIKYFKNLYKKKKINKKSKSIKNYNLIVVKFFKYFKLRRLRKKKNINRYKYRTWKNMYKVKKAKVYNITNLPPFKLKKLNTFFFKKKKKQSIKIIFIKIKNKLNKLLNSILNPSIKSFFTIKKKKKKLKMIQEFNFMKKKTIYIIINIKKKKLNIFSQLFKFYNYIILKKKKKINNSKSPHKFTTETELIYGFDLMLNFIKIKKIKRKWIKTHLFYIDFQNINNTKYKKQKNIFNYIFLNKNSVKSFYIDFYVKTKKIINSTKEIDNIRVKKKKIYYFNFWQRKLTTFKKARAIHWNIFTKKTIKKRRYKNFLFFFLKKNKNILHIFNHFIITFQLSYIFWLDFMCLYTKFYKNTYKKKQIYQLPISIFFWYFLKKHQLKKFKIKKKIKRWIAIKKRVKKKFWMKQKKKIPNFFSKQIYYSKQILNNIQIDYITNYFCIIKKNYNVTLINKIVNTNRLLKLHNFRYKS